MTFDNPGKYEYLRMHFYKCGNCEIKTIQTLSFSFCTKQLFFDLRKMEAKNVA